MTVDLDEDGKLSDEILKASFQKIRILQGLSFKLDGEIDESEYRRKKIQPKVNNIARNYKADYKEYFSRYFPNVSNDIVEDFIYFKSGANLRANLYRQKDENMLALISIFEESYILSDTNWGIALDDEQSGIQDETNLLLCFDVPELTMPIRLHIPKKIIVEHFKNVHQSNVIKVYEGSKDFVLNNKLMPSNGVYPTTKKFSTIINTLESIITEDMPIYNFIMHIKYLLDTTKFPRSMKKIVGKNKKGKIRYAKISRYVNLDTEQVISEQEAIQEMNKQENTSENLETPKNNSNQQNMISDNSNNIPATNDPNDDFGDI